MYLGLLFFNLLFAEQESAGVQAWVMDAWSKLPAVVRVEIGPIPEIKFKNLGRAVFSIPGCSVEPTQPQKHPVRYGIAIQVPGSKPRIVLHRGFLAEIEKGPKSCGYPFAVSTLVHEWAHLYDSKSKISRNPRFRALTHFQRLHNWKSDLLFLGFHPGPITQKNVHPHRSLNSNEFQNPREMFAYQFESFLLDPEYACRRPSLFTFYAKQFGDPFRRQRDCKVNRHVMLNSRNMMLDMKIPADLDPSRIAEVHYLFADRGSEMMSRWGHAMYRFIVCAPERKVVGPDCRQDIAYHVVVSYRANVSDVKINPIKGITGGYPSKMFLFPFVEIITEYTKEELRDLISIPVKLSDLEKKAFIESTLETYWTYSGRYTFLTNNCGTESLLLLKASSDAVNESRIHSFTPYKLLNTLTKAGWLDRATETRFKSKKTDLDRAIQILGVEWEVYFEKNAQSRSALVLEKINDSPKKREQIAAAAFVIETSVEFQKSKALEKLLMAKVEKSGPKIIQDMKDFAKIAQGQEPWMLTQSGYGIPLSEDFRPLAQDNDSKLKQTLESFIKWVGQSFESEVAEIKNTQANKTQFRKWILTQP